MNSNCMANVIWLAICAGEFCAHNLLCRSTSVCVCVCVATDFESRNLCAGRNQVACATSRRVRLDIYVEMRAHNYSASEFHIQSVREAYRHEHEPNALADLCAHTHGVELIELRTYIQLIRTALLLRRAWRRRPRVYKSSHTYRIARDDLMR